MNDVDVSRVNVIRLNEGGKQQKHRGDSDNNMFMEMCDAALVEEAIGAHIDYKRRCHLELQNLAENPGHTNPEMMFAPGVSGGSSLLTAGTQDKPVSAKKQQSNHHINVKLVRKVMLDFNPQNTKDLLARQLADAGIDVDAEEKEKKAKKMVVEASSKYKVQAQTLKLENFGKPIVFAILKINSLFFKVFLRIHKIS